MANPVPDSRMVDFFTLGSSTKSCDSGAPAWEAAARKSARRKKNRKKRLSRRSISVQALDAPGPHAVEQFPVHLSDGVPTVGEHGIALDRVGAGIEQIEDLRSLIDAPAGKDGELRQLLADILDGGQRVLV